MVGRANLDKASCAGPKTTTASVAKKESGVADFAGENPASTHQLEKERR